MMMMMMMMSMSTMRMLTVRMVSNTINNNSYGNDDGAQGLGFRVWTTSMMNHDIKDPPNPVVGLRSWLRQCPHRKYEH